METGSEREKAVSPLVVVIGEQRETGVQVVQALLGNLSSISERLVLLLARRTKFLRPVDHADTLGEYDHLKARADALGLQVELKLVSGRDPFGSVARECEALEAANPGALFCFIEWGSEELARSFAARGLRTTHLAQLLNREGAELELSA